MLTFQAHPQARSWFALHSNGSDVVEYPADEHGEPDHGSASLVDPRCDDWELCQVMYAVLVGLINMAVTTQVIVHPLPDQRGNETALTPFLTAGVPSTQPVLVFGPYV